MSEASDRPITAEDLDRLVDGQLDDPQRARLLELLDDTPGGWRRCALAFLEAQAWQQTCTALASGAAPPKAIGAAQRRSDRATWRTLLTAAAAALLAFFAGTWQAGRSSDRHLGRSQRRATDDSAAVVRKPTIENNSPIPYSLVVNTPQGNVVLPVYPVDQVDDAWTPAQVTSQSAGTTNRVHRDWHTVTLDDGRQVVVPIDEVELDRRTMESLANIQ